jgi:hypothetical protein
LHHLYAGVVWRLDERHLTSGSAARIGTFGYHSSQAFKSLKLGVHIIHGYTEVLQTKMCVSVTRAQGFTVSYSGNPYDDAISRFALYETVSRWAHPVANDGEIERLDIPICCLLWVWRFEMYMLKCKSHLADPSLFYQNMAADCGRSKAYDMPKALSRRRRSDFVDLHVGVC